MSRLTPTPHDREPTCRRCFDTGWVELLGEDEHGYERGVTGCRWCDRGLDKLAEEPSLTQRYREEDCTPVVWTPPGRAPEPAPPNLRRVK